MTIRHREPELAAERLIDEYVVLLQTEAHDRGQAGDPSARIWIWANLAARLAAALDDPHGTRKNIQNLLAAAKK